MKCFLLLIALLFPSLCFGAVAFDVCSTANVTAATSLTWSHTVTGTNPLIVAGYHGRGGSGGEVSGITYNAVGLSFKAVYYGSTDPGAGIEVYYNTGIATGAHNVVISNFDTADYVGSACSFTGVDQAAPLGTPVTNETDPLDSGSVTVPANGMAYELGLYSEGIVSCQSSVATGSGQTKQYEDCAHNVTLLYQLGFGSTRTTTGSFTYALDDNSAATHSIAIPINSATGGAITTTATRRRNQ